MDGARTGEQRPNGVPVDHAPSTPKPDEKIEAVARESSTKDKPRSEMSRDNAWIGAAEVDNYRKRKKAAATVIPEAKEGRGHRPAGFCGPGEPGGDSPRNHRVRGEVPGMTGGGFWASELRPPADGYCALPNQRFGPIEIHGPALNEDGGRMINGLQRLQREDQKRLSK